METDLLTRFHGYKPQKTRDQNPDADKFPLFFGWNRVANEYLSIDYEDIPKSINISGERNLFANAYRRIFNY